MAEVLLSSLQGTTENNHLDNNLFIPTELAVLEISPLLCVDETDNNEGTARPPIRIPPLSPFMAKAQLRQLCLSSVSGSLSITWETHTKKEEEIRTPSHDGITHLDTTEENIAVLGGPVTLSPSSSTRSDSPSFHLIKLKSDDPTVDLDIHCVLRGYAVFPGRLHRNSTSRQSATRNPCIVSRTTMVRILPPTFEKRPRRPRPVTDDSFLQTLLSVNASDPTDIDDDAVLSAHDRTTVNALAIRMGLLLNVSHEVSTAADAVYRREADRKRKDRMRRLCQQRVGKVAAEWARGRNAGGNQKDDETMTVTAARNCDAVESGSGESSTPPVSTPHRPPAPDRQQLLQEGCLTIYNSTASSGKTSLVCAIARKILKCQSVHVLNPGMLFGKYGVNYSDAALECLLHDIAIGGAVKGHRVCVVLDCLDGFVGSEGAADQSVPALNAIAAYLSHLSKSLKTNHRFPYPLKNKLYNLNSDRGHILPLRICIVGVVTFHGTTATGNSRGDKSSNLHTLNILGGRFLLPPPSADARHTALSLALERAGVKLDDDARRELPASAASAIRLQSAAGFEKVARRLRTEIAGQYRTVKGAPRTATADQLRRAMEGDDPARTVTVGTGGGDDDNDRDHGGKNVDDIFSSVGGNADAKKALINALALDPARRARLAAFGLAPPTGVLLYGPPGNGKTLLARATYESFRAGGTTSSPRGASFIALKASEVVQATVGTSEKLIAETFQTARENAPSVIFIDEFQALFTEREASAGSSGRLASTLLQCMDDVTMWRDADRTAGDDVSARIVILGATNVPWMVDSAFLRPGRFDRVVHVGLPTLEERDSILRIHLSQMRLSTNGGGDCGENIARSDGDCDGTAVDAIAVTLAKLCDGFSGADLAALCRAAAVRCLIEEDEKGGYDGEVGFVEKRHFVEAREHDVGRSTDDDLVRRLFKWRP